MVGHSEGELTVSENDRDTLAFMEEEAIAACERGLLRTFVHKKCECDQSERWRQMARDIRDLSDRLRACQETPATR